MAQMHWIRHNWLALVVLVAIAGSFLITDHDSQARDRAQATQLVQGCVKNSKRTALGAAGWDKLNQRVRARNAPGDERSADIYLAVSEGMAEELPAPVGADPQALVRATYDPATKRLVLDPQALVWQKRGCEELYR